MAHLNSFDWMLIGIILLSAGHGFYRGFVRAALGLAGLVGGFYVASLYYRPVADFIEDVKWTDSTPTARIVGFVLIVSAIGIGAEVLGRLMKKALRKMGLGPLDRLMGAVFGVVRGALVGVVLLLIPTIFRPHSELITKSVLSPYLFAAVHDVSFLVPQYLQQRLLSSGFTFQ